jgi:GLPGLI family protein
MIKHTGYYHPSIPSPLSGFGAIRAVVIGILFLTAMPMVRSQDSVQYVRYDVTKNWVKMIEAVDYISQQQKEKARYMYGNRRGFTSHTKLYFNDSVSMYGDDFEDEESFGYSWLKEPYLIRRDFTRRQIHDVVTWLRKVMIIEDTLVYPTWKMLNDVREIAGHICMNATCTDTVKGQKIIAWFALDIPSPAGPERFCGLPGLILGLEVNGGAMEIMAQKIEKVPMEDHLVIPVKFDGRKIKGKHISEADYQSRIYKYMEEKRRDLEYPFWGIRY